MLLHRENFFEELEFFDKESVSQTAYQKLRHRLNRVDEREVKRSSAAALGLLRWLEAIAGFSTTYTKMKPILKQLEAAEADLMHIQKELGHARVALGHLKSKYDSVDKQRLAQTDLVQKLNSEIRRQKNELKSLDEFLKNLDFCTTQWRENFAELKYQKNYSKVENLIAVMFVFLLTRFSRDKMEEILESAHQVATDIFKELRPVEGKTYVEYFSDVLTPGRNNTGKREMSKDLWIKFLNSRNLKHHLQDWTENFNMHPTAISLNLRPDKSEIRQIFSEALKSNDLIKQENIHRWNDEMIVQEIKGLEQRLFDVIIDNKVPLVELRHLRKIVEKRKNAKASNILNLRNNDSLLKDHIGRLFKINLSLLLNSQETLFLDQLHDLSLLSLNSFLQLFLKSKIM